MGDEMVLVTGGTGFVGVNCILRLLDDPAVPRIRTTVRDLRRADDLRDLVRVGGGDPRSLEIVAADLTRDEGWAEATAGMTHVLHVASPFPANQPKDENELIVPAREGALRVLRAARDAGAKRVVQTSSFAAIGYSSHPDGPFTEEDWTDPDQPRISAYVKSKTLAERAAWDFIDREGGGTELTVVNPVIIFGPPLGSDLSTSLELLLVLLNGGMPAVPRGSASVVDVRDVADLHVRAMRHPDAAGERFLAVTGEPFTFPELAELLREELGSDAKRVPKRVMPDWLVRTGAPFNSNLRAIASELGRLPRASHEKATRLLDWNPRSREESALASARRLIELGLVNT